MSKRRIFTQSENDFIRANYRSMSCRDIGEHLGRHPVAIAKRANRMGITKVSIRRWTETEDEIIRTVGRCELREIADKLGRGVSEVSARSRKLGLGPWRKRWGYKPDAQGRTVREYIRRNGKCVRRMEHRAVMEEYLGRTLERCELVHHIDCDKANNRIQNLFLCKSRAEHQRVHCSLNGIIASLLERGIVRFNRRKGIYELCETNK